jgi:putative membrane protein
VRFLKYLIILFVMVLGVAFASLNEGHVTLNYHYGELDLALPWVVLAAIALGVLLGWLASLGSLLRIKRENASLRRKANVASEEVKNLRAIPLKDQ